jgi:hypothetical protein
MALARNFDFNRFASFLRGLTWENSLISAVQFTIASCKCDDCLSVRNLSCGTRLSLSSLIELKLIFITGQTLLICSIPIYQRVNEEEISRASGEIWESFDGKEIIIPGPNQ